jgi:restriction system protein
VGVKAIQEAVAAKGYYDCTHAIVVTNSRYTRQAMQLARTNGVELWDRSRLVRALLAAQREPTTAAGASGLAAAPQTGGSENEAASAHPGQAVCATCGKPVSERVREYCLAHAQRFGGQIYCYEHQRQR